LSEKHINLTEGDTLVIQVVGSKAPADEAEEVLLKIGGTNIYTNPEQNYVRFTSNLDVCNDGSGPEHGDPYHQAQTAYWNNGNFLNADVDRYVVVPPQIRAMVPGVVMGCQARATNLKTGVWSAGVVGDIGPETKTGEAAYCLAKILNPEITHNTGDDELIYLYELWPDMPARVGDKTYKLQPA
jgi:hypothetical protein